MPAHLENSAGATGLEKVTFHSNPKGHAKERSNDHTVALMSHTRKVMLKILQVRLQQLVNRELPMFRLDLENAEEPERSNCQHRLDHQKSKSSQKTSTSALLTIPKPLLWITAKCGKFLKRWE
ncbi:unnamed protein product [Rangifer tarandus platyrhynchus]|uniref:Uncharacterized protein n=1 Tax=Rangifer tarandus platyrhynchus TaxID=3082113 RepID=A0ABN8XQK2_RANTA|nr:unnamed protein product [Rangifer tarandus platyrhynchus]